MGAYGPRDVDFSPVLKAIEALSERIGGLESRMGSLEGEVRQQGMLMRAMARVTLSEDVMATTLSDRDLENEIVRKDAEEQRRKKREENLDQFRQLGRELG